MEPATLIALGALLFSGLAVIVSIRTHRRMPELTALQIDQLRQVADAQSSADVRVEPRRGAVNTVTIDVVNHGPAEASNVRVEAIEGAEALTASELSRNFPVERLRVGGRASMLAAPSSGETAILLTVRWRDDAGDHSEDFPVDLITG